MALIMAQDAQQVTGIEVVTKAVADAIASAHLNNITNAIFLTAAAEDILPVSIAHGFTANEVQTVDMFPHTALGEWSGWM